MDKDLIHHFIHEGIRVTNPHSSSVYEIMDSKPLGSGGFGHVFDAVHEPEGDRVCLKFMTDQASWHREAYFGTLMAGNSRVVQCLESFPFSVVLGKVHYLFFVLVFEYMPNGSIWDYLQRTGPWLEERAKREIRALLQALNEIHGGGAVHRDITPLNVLVTANGSLRLADFGVAGHRLASHEVFGSAFNRWFAPREKRRSRKTKWLMADDVYQMGQLLGMLLQGAGDPLTAHCVQTLGCSDEIRAVILKAIGPPDDRYENAYEMTEALDANGETEAPRMRTLNGKRVVFTGPFSIRRDHAILLLYQAGGEYQDEVHANTDVVVVGGRSPHYKHRVKGTKLAEVDKWKKKGKRISLLSEAQFMRLANK